MILNFQYPELLLSLARKYGMKALIEQGAISYQFNKPLNYFSLVNDSCHIMVWRSCGYNLWSHMPTNPSFNEIREFIQGWIFVMVACSALNHVAGWHFIPSVPEQQDYPPRYVQMLHLLLKLQRIVVKVLTCLNVSQLSLSFSERRVSNILTCPTMCIILPSNHPGHGG